MTSRGVTRETYTQRRRGFHGNWGQDLPESAH